MEASMAAVCNIITRHYLLLVIYYISTYTFVLESWCAELLEDRARVGHGAVGTAEAPGLSVPAIKKWPKIGKVWGP
ncbi:hypothetical protein L1887_06067 [Cichorium endivia]|nr:hypothetical protein L1887_06067 [Cichorium endivia]